MEHNMNRNIKSKSSEIDLINLLDNVHLSSRNNDNKEKQLEEFQLRMLQEFCSTSNLRKQDCSTSNIDEAQLASFFDKYEKPKQELNKKQYKQLNSEDLHQFEELNEINDSKNNKNNSRHDDNFFVKTDNASFDLVDNLTPRVLIPKLKVENENNEEVINKTEIINEDLIEEVMFEQQLEKQIYKKKSEKLEMHSDINKPVQVTQREVKNSIDDNILDQIIKENKVTNFDKLAFTKNSNTKEIPNSRFTTEKTNLQQKALTEELVTRYNINYLEAVKKNDKAFRSSAFKSDAEKLNLTVGPSLYEKSVVLPQIMQRIKEKQREVEERGRLTMQLILDGGSKSKEGQLNVKLSEPEVLMADCNKERLKAFELFRSNVQAQ